MTKYGIGFFLAALIFLSNISVPVFSAEPTPAPTPFEAPEHPEDVLTPEMIAAPSAVLIDAKTGVVVFDKNKDEINYPASITKIMTALLVLENLPDMNARIKFSHESIFSLEPGSSHIAMNEDETLSVEDALYGLMLASANEVANAFAEEIAGDNETFARMMTNRARQLGAVNTNFTNPHGLHDSNHYTTAHDMALIMRECLKYPEFIKIISTVRHDIPPTEKQPEKRPLNNSHKMIHPYNSNYDEDVVGGKTGFTSEAQHTLITYGKRSDRELDIDLIAVVLHDLSSRTYADTRDMLNYGFTQFENVEIFDKKDFSRRIPVGDSVVSVGVEKSVNIYLPKSAVGRILQKDDLPDRLNASVKKGDRLGELELYCDGAPVAKVPLVALESVQYVPQAGDAESVQDGESPTGKSGDDFSFEKLLNIFLALCSVLLLILLCLLAYVLFRPRRKKTLKRRGEPRYRYRDDC